MNQEVDCNDLEVVKKHRIFSKFWQQNFLKVTLDTAVAKEDHDLAEKIVKQLNNLSGENSSQKMGEIMFSSGRYGEIK